MTEQEAKEREKFEKWFLSQDPEPFDGDLNLSPIHAKKHEQWGVRYFSAKLAYLERAREGEEESKLGGCYNLLCHTEKVQGEKKIEKLRQGLQELRLNGKVDPHYWYDGIRRLLEAT